MQRELGGSSEKPNSSYFSDVILTAEDRVLSAVWRPVRHTIAEGNTIILEVKEKEENERAGERSFSAQLVRSFHRYCASFA